MNIKPHSYCDKSISAPLPLFRARISAAIAHEAPNSAESVAQALQAAGVAAYPVVTMSGLFCDPQLFARRQFRVRRHPEMGDHAYCFPGFDLAGSPGDIVGPAPCVGADNDFVFRDLVGLSEDEYETYRRCGVLD